MKASVPRKDIRPLTIFGHDPEGKGEIYIALKEWKGEYFCIDESGMIYPTHPDADCYVLGMMEFHFPKPS